MDHDHATAAVEPADERYLTLADLAARLHVGAQAIYDLRSEGRGPVGFRVGRFLRFRASEVDDWLARLEREDQARHPRHGRAMNGRPRTPIGAYGDIAVVPRGPKFQASAYVRDLTAITAAHYVERGRCPTPARRDPRPHPATRRPRRRAADPRTTRRRGRPPGRDRRDGGRGGA